MLRDELLPYFYKTHVAAFCAGTEPLIGIWLRVIGPWLRKAVKGFTVCSGSEEMTVEDLKRLVMKHWQVDVELKLAEEKTWLGIQCTVKFV